VGVGLVAAVAAAPAARADVIFLTNGNTIQVDAWRDTGDAVEFTRSGGIIRILKTDISRIEGMTQSRDLRMYSAPASATVVPTASSSGAAAREMLQVLKEGEALFTQTVLDSQ
jgi:phosphoribosylformimino-5-aminoimidazole carboxamide ribonucleotide (ProFAR) isomerase